MGATNQNHMVEVLPLLGELLRFIKGYFTIADPLIDWLKRGRGWTRSQECQHAFDVLKKTITKEPVVFLSDLNKPFELHTDAYNFAIGGVLREKGHSITFESRKHNDMERQYTV